MATKDGVRVPVRSQGGHWRGEALSDGSSCDFCCCCCFHPRLHGTMEGTEHVLGTPDLLPESQHLEGETRFLSSLMTGVPRLEAYL